jgi:ParB family chromosome partitioning protein
VALVAVVHRLTLRVIHDAHYGSPLNITANPQDRLEHYAPDMTEAPAAVGMRRVCEAWAERLPSDPDAQFAELLAMPAAGTAVSAGGVRGLHRDGHRFA